MCLYPWTIPLTAWKPCVYSKKLSKEAVYGFNNVCPSTDCGVRQTVLVSDSLPKRCCKIVNHLSLHVNPYVLLTVPCPERQKWVFLYLFLYSFFLFYDSPAPFWVFFSPRLSTCPHLIITCLFNCLSFFLSRMNAGMPGWIKVTALQRGSCSFLPCARQCCYPILSSSTLFSQLNFVLAREATASPALKLLLLFNFRCIAFPPGVGIPRSHCASFI